MKHGFRIAAFAAAMILAFASIPDIKAEEITAETTQTQDLGIAVTAENFPQLYKTLSYRIYDANGDGYLSKDEIGNIRTLMVTSKVTNLKGIEKLTSLEMLVLKEYAGTKLTLGAENDRLKKLYVTPTGKSLTVDADQLKTLGVMPITGGYYKNGDVIVSDAGLNANAGCATVTRSLDIKKCKNLNGFLLSVKSIKKVTLPGSGNHLKTLCVSYSDLSSLKLSDCKNLEYIKLNCCGNWNKLDVSGNTNLKYLSLLNCPKLSGVNLSKNTKLEYALVSWNTGIKKLDLSKCKKIKGVDVNNRTTKVTMPGGKSSKCYYYDAKDYWSKSAVVGEAIRVNGIDLPAISLNMNEQKDWDYYHEKIVQLNKKNFPAFYEELVKNYADSDGDGWLTQDELDRVTALYTQVTTKDLAELAHFQNLKTLEIGKYTKNKLVLKNKRLLHLRFTATTDQMTVDAPYVRTLEIKGTAKVQTLDLSGCKSVVGLRYAGADWNQKSLSTLKLPKSGSSMKALEISDAKIGKLDTAGYPNLEYLSVAYCNNVKSLSPGKNAKLRGIWLTGTGVKSLDLSKNKKMEELYLYGNENCKVKKPSGVSLPKRDSNSWIYAVEYSTTMWY